MMRVSFARNELEGVGLTSNLLHFGAIITAFPDTRNLLTCIEFQ